MTKRKQQTNAAADSRIPEFASREEMAEWFDTHDLTDYWDELKPVKVRFAKNLSEGITIQLDAENLAQLRSIAAAKRVAPATLVRRWVLEQVKKHAEQNTTP